jgi:quercetin dioxygenase-like cupin family protein
MKQHLFVVPVVILMLMSGVAGLRSGATARAAVDAPITIETLGTGMPSDAPGKALLLLRVTIQPGAAFPAHIHPGTVVIAVESGDFGFTVLEGEAIATRAVASGTPEPAETLAVGTEAVMHAGDQVFEQAGVVHTARNAGTTPVVVLLSALVDPSQEFLMPVETNETPAA